MKTIITCIGMAVIAGLALTAAASAQTPGANETPAAKTTVTGTPTALSTALTASVTPRVTATAPAPAASPSMTVTAIVPAPAGTRVTLQALDLTTNQPVECGSMQSTADSAPAQSSRITFVVSPASCAALNSGLLRICWGPSSCQPLSFQAGKTVDLGVLTGPGPLTAPNTGGADQGSSGGLAKLLLYASIGLLGAGGIGLGGSALVRHRRNQNR